MAKSKRKEPPALEVAVGESVYYHPIIGEPHTGVAFTVRDVGTLPSGEPVAWLDGKAGCVSRHAISRVTPK